MITIKEIGKLVETSPGYNRLIGVSYFLRKLLNEDENPLREYLNGIEPDKEIEVEITLKVKE